MSKNRRQIFFQEHFQVRNNSLIFYALPTEKLPQRYSEFKTKTYSGATTKGTTKRIRKCVDLLIQLSPPRKIYNPITNRHSLHTLSFITLTIPAKERHLTAKEGYDLLLSKWLQSMRRRNKMNTYVWKAEFQKNGQLHYHITTPSWIIHTDIKETWNDLLYKAGMLKLYQEEHPNQFPNSTDVHKVYKIKNMAAYLTKYLCKSSQDKNTTGKIWDASANIKGAKFFSLPDPEQWLLPFNQKAIIIKDRVGILPVKEPKKFLQPNAIILYHNYLKTLNEKAN